MKEKLLKLISKIHRYILLSSLFFIAAICYQCAETDEEVLAATEEPGIQRFVFRGDVYLTPSVVLSSSLVFGGEFDTTIFIKDRDDEVNDITEDSCDNIPNNIEWGANTTGDTTSTVEHH